MDDLGSTAGVVLITLIAYKLGLISIGVLASRFTHDETDFFLGGRKMGPWVAGLSYAASTSSAWVLLGYTGFVYDQGVSALWMVPGILGAYAVIWLFSARACAQRRHRTNTSPPAITTVLSILLDTSLRTSLRTTCPPTAMESDPVRLPMLG